MVVHVCDIPNYRRCLFFLEAEGALCVGVGVDQGTPTLQLVLFHSDFSIFLISEIFRVGKCWEDMKSPLFSCVVIKSTTGRLAGTTYMATLVPLPLVVTRGRREFTHPHTPMVYFASLLL